MHACIHIYIHRCIQILAVGNGANNILIYKMHTHTYIQSTTTCMHAYIYTYIDAYRSWLWAMEQTTSSYIRIHTHTYKTHTCMHAYMHACMHVIAVGDGANNILIYKMQKNTHTYTIHTHAYIHTYIHTSLLCTYNVTQEQQRHCVNFVRISREDTHKGNTVSTFTNTRNWGTRYLHSPRGTPYTHSPDSF